MGWSKLKLRTENCVFANANSQLSNVNYVFCKWILHLVSFSLKCSLKKPTFSLEFSLLESSFEFELSLSMATLGHRSKLKHGMACAL